MMDHIFQRDWCARSNHMMHDQFVDEAALDNCVIERIIQNRFWDPLISSDEEGPPGPIDWDAIFKQKNSHERDFRVFVPGFHKAPPYPKVSALTREEQWKCLKVLCAQNPKILPYKHIGRPTKHDWRIFEEKKQIYAKEQQEYIEWAKQLWVTTNCIRALRPKPLLEQVYEAEYKLKCLTVQCFPASYTMAAQIPLKADNHTCEMVLPKMDLIKVDVSKLRRVLYPNINESRASVLVERPSPEPCAQHPCRFTLPHANETSLLPLTDIHKELAQFALEHGAEFVASENSIKCLIETERSWSLPVSVCEVIAPDGETMNIVVMGSEFPERKEPAPTRTYRAYRHLLLNAFTNHSPRERTVTNCSDSSDNWPLRSPRTTKTTPRGTNFGKMSNKNNKPVSTNTRGAAAVYNSAVRKVAAYTEASDDSDDDDDDRLQIDLDDGDQSDNQNNLFIDENCDETIDDTNANTSTELNHSPRKILKARPRRSIDATKINQVDDTDIQESNQVNGQEKIVPEEVKNDKDSPKSNQVNGQDSSKVDNSDAISQLGGQDLFDISLNECKCKDSKMEIPPRSYKKVQVKNLTTKDKVNIIIHSSHKLKDGSSEVILEPIVEYQLDIGGTQQSPQKIQSLALSLMLRKHAVLANVRVDGVTGDVVTVDTVDLRELTSQHGDYHTHIANTLHTALNQLAGLLPGQYLLKHEPSHGANAVLFSRACLGAGGAVPLLGARALSPAEEARLVHAAPRLAPVLLPIHKFRGQLPLAFTYNEKMVARENTHVLGKKNTPPAAIQWPKRKGRKRKKGKTANVG